MSPAESRRTSIRPSGFPSPCQQRALAQAVAVHSASRCWWNPFRERWAELFPGEVVRERKPSPEGMLLRFIQRRVVGGILSGNGGLCFLGKLCANGSRAQKECQCEETELALARSHGLPGFSRRILPLTFPKDEILDVFWTYGRPLGRTALGPGKRQNRRSFWRSELFICFRDGL